MSLPVNMKSAHIRTVAISMLYMFVMAGYLSAMTVMYAEYPSWFNADYTTLAIPGSICSAIQFFLGMVSIYVIRRLKTRWCMLLGGIICVIDCLATGFNHSIYVYTAAYALRGVLRCVCFYTMITRLIMKWFIKDRRFYIGICTGIALFGTSAFQALAGFVFPRCGMTYTCLINGAIALAVAVIGFIFIEEDPEKIGELPYGYSADSVVTGKEKVPKPQEKERNSSNLIKNPVFWIIMAATVFNVYNVSQIMTYVTTYLPKYGMPFQTAAVVLSVMGLIGGLLTMISGAIADKMSLGKYVVLIYGAGFLANFMMIAYAYVQSPVVILLLIVTYSAGLMYGPFENIMVGPVFGDEDGPDALSKIEAMEAGSRVVLKPILASVITNYGFQQFFAVSGTLSVIAMLGYLCAFSVARRRGMKI